jgi:hypothetical protein
MRVEGLMRVCSSVSCPCRLFGSVVDIAITMHVSLKEHGACKIGS